MKPIAAVLFGSFVLTLTIAAYSQERKPDGKKKAFAEGAIVAITVLGAVNNAGIYLDEPELKKIGESWFLVGNMAELPGYPAPPKTVRSWVAVNTISTMYEYEDVEDLLKTFKTPAKPGS